MLRKLRHPEPLLTIVGPFPGFRFDAKSGNWRNWPTATRWRAFHLSRCAAIRFNDGHWVGTGGFHERERDEGFSPARREHSE